VDSDPPARPRVETPDHRSPVKASFSNHHFPFRAAWMATLALAMAGALPAATKSWSNGGADNHWNNPANWSPTGEPANGDDLVFPAGSDAVTDNNLSGRTFGSLTMQTFLTIQGNAFTLTGGVVSTPGGIGGAVVIEPNISLGASQSFTSGGGVVSTLTFEGSVLFGAHTLTLAGSRPLTFGGITGSSTAGSQLLRTGTGRLRFGPASLFVSPAAFDWNTGSLDIDGIFQAPLALTGGTLTGAGTLGLGLDASGGSIVPDEADLSVSGNTLLRGNVVLRVELLGPSDEHALECSGGSVTLEDNATLEFADNAYVPVRGDVFNVLQKSTAGPIAGAFRNAAEGAEFTDGTSIVRFSYAGGNGNDGVLATAAVTRTWDGGATLNDNWEDADNWSGNIAPQAGDILVFPTGIGGTDRGLDNNFPNDTTFRQLVFNGDDFTVRGNRFRLSHGVHAAAGVTVHLDTDVTLVGPQTWHAGGTIELDVLDKIDTAGHALTLTGGGLLLGEITGAGGVVLPAADGQPAADITFRQVHSYTGLTEIREGSRLTLERQSGLNVDPSPGSTAAGTQVRGELRVDNKGVNGTLTVAEGLQLFPFGALTSMAADNGLNMGRNHFTGHIAVGAQDSGSAHIATEGGQHEFSGGLSGSGRLNLNLAAGSGEVTTFSGSSPSTFSGIVTVQQGVLRLEKSGAGVVAISGTDFNLTSSPAGSADVETREDEQIADACRVALTANARLRIGNVTARTETIGALTLSAFPTPEVGSGPTVDGPESSQLILAGGLLKIGPFNGTVSVATRLTAAESVWDIREASQFMAAPLTRSGTAALRKSGAGTLLLKSRVAVPVRVSEGLVYYEENADGDGALSPVTLDGGSVSGSGRCGALSAAAGGGTVFGNAAFDQFSAGTVVLNAATTVRVQISGDGSHDRLSVSGSVSLGGAALVIAFESPGAPADGQVFLPVVNDGTDAISGIFGGLPEGAAIPVPGGGVLLVSYQGGDGNDVSLTRAAAAVPTVLEGITFTQGGGPAGLDRVTIAGSGQPSAVFHVEASAELLFWTRINSATAGISGAFTIAVDQTPGLPERFFRLTR